VSAIEFWGSDCPARGPSLGHAHWERCYPESYHPGTSDKHTLGQCCHCGHTAETWERRVIESIADPASLQTAFDGDCAHTVNVTTPLIGDGGQVWPVCGDCGVQKEPKFATGELVGPRDAISRGWVNPRMKNRWTRIALLAQRDDETNLKPLDQETRDNIAAFLG
jgi:hypothetical protein